MAFSIYQSKLNHMVQILRKLKDNLDYLIDLFIYCIKYKMKPKHCKKNNFLNRII